MKIKLLTIRLPRRDVEHFCDLLELNGIDSFVEPFDPTMPDQINSGTRVVTIMFPDLMLEESAEDICEGCGEPLSGHDGDHKKDPPKSN